MRDEIKFESYEWYERAVLQCCKRLKPDTYKWITNMGKAGKGHVLDCIILCYKNRLSIRICLNKLERVKKRLSS